MPELAKGLVAAAATPLVLSILSQGDSYGYAIIARVRELSDGQLEWADGMLYPILHRLEARAHITSHWGVAETGRRRKYYRLLDAGREALAEQREHWNMLHTILNDVAGAACPT